jgi:hypothetical protein
MEGLISSQEQRFKKRVSSPLDYSKEAALRAKRRRQIEEKITMRYNDHKKRWMGKATN